MIRLLNILASLKLTLVGMLLLGSGVLYAQDRSEASSAWMIAPLALLALNLLAAMLVNRRFQRQPALLAFHVCLLMIVVLAGYGRLTQLEGRVEVSEGQVFDPEQVEVIQRGELHRFGLEPAAFEQGSIGVEYAPGMRRGQTRSEVWTVDAQGHRTARTVGDDSPLLTSGYRFYTTSNKGFSILLNWTSRGGEIERGTVHLPSYPAWLLRQKNLWLTPAGEELELRLELERVPEEDAWVLESRGRGAAITLQRQAGGDAIRLEPGESAEVEGGQVRFDELRMWMGYRISYDPTPPWIAASALAAVLFMAWNFRQTLWSVAPAQAQGSEI